jgi:hypothetical protein
MPPSTVLTFVMLLLEHPTNASAPVVAPVTIAKRTHLVRMVETAFPGGAAYLISECARVD